MNTVDIDIKFMQCAIDEAKHASSLGEIPVGCVIVKDGLIIVKSRNGNRAQKNPIRHAEITAIEDASRKINNERLTDCEMYVTKEPCAMCAGAIIHARIKRLIIASEDEKYGACGTVLNVCGNENLNHRPEIIFGVMRKEASGLLSDFFKKLRDT
jgi:tRNA(adenine34) deaminase